MSEHVDNDKPELKVRWLLNLSGAELSKRKEIKDAHCKLNDYSQFETWQMMQAADSEDRL